MDSDGCHTPGRNLSAVIAMKIADCFQLGKTIEGNTVSVDIGDLRNSSFEFITTCNQTGQEIFININNPLMDVNMLNALVVTQN